MALSKEAQEARPKKPQGVYFHWRLKRLAELKEDENKK